MWLPIGVYFLVEMLEQRMRVQDLWLAPSSAWPSEFLNSNLAPRQSILSFVAPVAFAPFVVACNTSSMRVGGTWYRRHLGKVSVDKDSDKDEDKDEGNTGCRNCNGNGDDTSVHANNGKGKGKGKRDRRKGDEGDRRGARSSNTGGEGSEASESDSSCYWPTPPPTPSEVLAQLEECRQYPFGQFDSRRMRDIFRALNLMD